MKTITLHMKEFRHQKGSSPFFSETMLSFEQGKIHFLNGQNGSGKSTLFALFRGDKQGDGSIHFNGSTFPLGSKIIRSKVALVNQKFDGMIADQFTFSDNLRFASMAKRPLPFKTLSPCLKLPPFLDRFGINPDMPANKLSGGQRQILAILMILQQNPKILLLDEPTATLDPENSRIVFEFLKTLDLTMIVISHDQKLIEEYISGNKYEIVVENGLRKVVEKTNHTDTGNSSTTTDK